MGALFTGRPRMWGHSSRCFAFGGVCGDTPLVALPSEGCPHYYPWAVRFRLHPHLTRSFFPRREKRSLIPPCAPSTQLLGLASPPPQAKPAEPPPQSRLRSCLPFAHRPHAAGIEPMVANSGMQLLGLASPPPQAKPAEPPLHKKEDTEKTGRLSDYRIGGLPVYQAGGPPIDFEKTR